MFRYKRPAKSIWSQRNLYYILPFIIDIPKEQTILSGSLLKYKLEYIWPLLKTFYSKKL